MKKNISINISGIIFHIEEDGYETLRKYLDSINKYFGAFEDSSEILADIESRIAEIFLGKLNEGKQVITTEDVQGLITTMGNVNDFKAAEEQEFASEPASRKEEPRQHSQQSSSSKKLVRDKTRQIIGGVCAGLAHYFSIDPVWPRLIFALLTLGYGSGLLVYIVLWIALPVSDQLEEENDVKKMYRNPESKVIGGVAGGIGAFFNIDPIVIRLLFVAMIFAGGLGLILYLVLWVSIPEAKTITEKIKMQGEPVTLSNIESNAKKNQNEKEQQDETPFAKIIFFPFRLIGVILNGIAKAIGPVLKGLLDVVRVLIGLFILLTGLILVLSVLFSFGILLGIFTYGSIPASWDFMNWEGISLPLEAIKNTFSTWVIVASFIVCLVPALFIQLLGASIMARKMVINAFFGWTLFVMLFISIAYLSFILPGIVLSFKEEGEFITEKTFATSGIPVLNIKEVGLDDYKLTDLTLKGYEGSEIKLVEKFMAQGHTRKQANENAHSVEYQVTQMDSVLTFDSNITFAKGVKFKVQRLEMDLFIPYNKPFIIAPGLWRMIDNYGKWNYDVNDSRQTWKLTDKGLECITCPSPPKSALGLGEKDQYGFKDFTEIDIKGIFDLTIVRSDTYSVQVEGERDEKRKYDVEQNGDRLRIRNIERENFNSKGIFLDKDHVRITITLPSLVKLKITGAGEFKVSGFHEPETEIKLLGAMSGEANISIDKLSLDLSGPLVFELDGEGNFMEANVNKLAQLKASRYKVNQAVVEAREVGRAWVNAISKIEIDTDVLSSVKYQGNPEVIKNN